MTLVARPKPPAYHKKLSGSHHRHSKAYRKTYWPYIPLLAVVVVGALLNSVLPGKHSVLGYATDISQQNLLVDTNQQRESNGENDLSLNQQLVNAAQAKANDMAARDYWSHNTPDGKTPWTFMTAAGYNYQLAGENLAYGFATAADTLTGWMNSPEHRANILNAGYKDVGFGFVNIPDYQNTGPETLVVAMYGAPEITPVVAAATPPPVSRQSAAVPSGGSATSPVSTQTSTAQTPSAAQDKNNTVEPQQTQTLTPSARQAVQASESQTQSVSRVQVLTAGRAPWSLLVLSLAGSAALIVFLLRHGLAWHRIFVRGEEFILHHPLLDVVLVSVVTLSALLAHQSGSIR